MPDADQLKAELAERDVPCPGCGYNLRGVAEPVCPECGRAVTIDDLDALPATLQIWPRSIIIGQLAALAGVYLVILGRAMYSLVFRTFDNSSDPGYIAIAATIVAGIPLLLLWLAYRKQDKLPAALFGLVWILWIPSFLISVLGMALVFSII